ncbi:MAG: ABC transporter permease [Lachnospiraceae bacterium]|nr:ABC transporter permease [Lachnospiraceae bacterium]
MTFKDVIIKNFKGDINKYVSFFFSGVFCVAMFFTYSTLALLDDISKSVETYPMELLMIVTCLMVFLFSIFFISYSHGNFVRNKKKELATYMMLGMNEKEGMLLLAVETGIIAIASIIVGIVTGLVFSRLFQIIALRIIDIEISEYKLAPINFIATFLTFVLIFIGCIVVSITKIKKQDITSIIKDSRKKEKRQYGVKNLILFILGVILLIFSIVFVLNVAPNSDINYKMWVVLSFIVSGYLGTYLIIIHGIGWVLEQKKTRKNYYENILSVSGMEHKFRQNTRIIVILSMLASMIVLLVGSPIALLKISTDIAEEANADIEYMITGSLEPSDIEKIIDSDEIVEEKVDHVSYVFDNEHKIYPVMPASSYNEKYNADIHVESGEIAVITITWIPGTNGYAVGTELALASVNDSLKYTIAEITKGDFLCVNLFSGGCVYVLCDEDYENIREQIFESDVHQISLKSDWKNSESINNELTEFIASDGITNSKIKQYIMLKHGYGMFLFVSCSMCFMFFVSTGFVLYFKQYNDIDEDKARYMQLYKIGISDKAVKKSIRKKMSVVYFVPLIGGVMGIAIMYYLSNLFGGTDIVKVFMSKSYIGFALYFVSQIMFYLLLKTKYTKDVLAIDEP